MTDPIGTGWSLRAPDYQPSNFGIKGDGVTDDTAAIQAMIDYAEKTAFADGTNGMAWLGPGTYQISGQINVPYGVRLVGSGSRSTRIRVASTFAALTTTGAIRLGDGSAFIFGTALEDLMIECSSIAGSIGVYSSDVQNASGLKRVLVNNFRSYGCLFDGNGNQAASGSINAFFIEDCEFYKANTGGSGGVGLSLQNGTFYASIKNCTVYADAANPLTTGYEAVNFPMTLMNCSADGSGSGAGTDAVKFGTLVEGGGVFGLVTNGWTTSVNITATSNVVLVNVQRILGTNVVVDAGNGTPNAVTITDTFCPLYVRGNNARTNINLTAETLTANASITTPTADIAAVSSASTTFGTTGIETTVTVGQGTTGTELAVMNVRAGNGVGAISRYRLSRNTTTLADFLTDGSNTFLDFTGTLKLRGTLGVVDSLLLTSAGAATLASSLTVGSLTSGKYPIASTGGLLINGPTPLAGTKIYYVSDTSGGAVTRKLTFTDGILTAET